MDFFMTISISANRQSVEFTEQTLDGKTYLVGPMVLAKVGVMNGLLMTHEEMTKNLPAWGDIAIPLSHPADGEGNFLSAKDPTVLKEYSVGRFMNPFVEKEMLKGEAWIDVEKANSLDDGKRLLDAANNGMPLEVSSGFFADIEEQLGAYGGDEYAGVWKNIVPDHAAILLDEIGACSLDDGCGLSVNEEKGIMQALKDKFSDFIDELTSSQQPAVNQLQANCDCEPATDSKDLQMNDDVKDEVKEPEVKTEEKTPEVAPVVTPEPVVEPAPAATPEATDQVEALKAQLGAVNGFFERFGGMDKAAEIMTNAAVVLEREQTAEQTEREQLKAALATNGLSDADIAATPITVLRSMAGRTAPVDYSGRGAPVIVNNETGPPAPPAVLLAKNEESK